MFYRTLEKPNLNKWCVFIHCMGGNNAVFIPQIKEYSKYFNLLLIDLPGHGKSLQDSYDFTFDTIVDEIKDILDKLNISKVCFLASSIGCVIALKFCTKYSNRVDSAILVGAATDFSFRLLKYLFFIFIKIKVLLPKALYMYIITKCILPFHSNKEERKKLYNYCMNMDKKYLFRWLYISSKELFYFRKKTNKILLNSEHFFALYVSGNNDYVFKKSILRDIKFGSSNKLVFMNNCSHLCNLDNPSLFNEITLHYLRQKRKKEVVLIDLDGTLIDYKSVDDKFMKMYFGAKSFIERLNAILWYMNELDYISTKRWMFVVRFAFYSIFSEHNVLELLYAYALYYREEIKEEVIKNYNKVLILNEYGYEVKIITHNLFAKDSLANIPIISVSNKRKYIKKYMLGEYDVKYIIGNNYNDDIKTAFNLKMFPIYLGKSKLIKKLIRNKNCFNATSLDDAIEFIINSKKTND